MTKKTDIPAALKLPPEDDMRERFAYLNAEIDRIQAETTPLREKRDELVNAHSKEIKALEMEYLEKEHSLFPMKQELASLARLLKGKTVIDQTALEEETEAS